MAEKMAKRIEEENQGDIAVEISIEVMQFFFLCLVYLKEFQPFMFLSLQTLLSKLYSTRHAHFTIYL